MFKAHASRFKSDKDVTDEDFQQPIHSQPIVIKSSILTSVGLAGPGLVGAAVGALGLLAGPVGAVTIPNWLLGGNSSRSCCNCHIQL